MESLGSTFTLDGDRIRWRPSFVYNAQSMILAPPLHLSPGTLVNFFLHHEKTERGVRVVPGVFLQPGLPVMAAAWNGLPATDRALDSQVKSLEIPSWSSPVAGQEVQGWVSAAFKAKAKAAVKRTRQPGKRRTSEDLARIKVRQVASAMNVSHLFAFEPWCSKVLRRHYGARLPAVNGPASSAIDHLALAASLRHGSGELTSHGRPRASGYVDPLKMAVLASLMSRPGQTKTALRDQLACFYKVEPDHIRKLHSPASALLTRGVIPTVGSADQLLAMADFLPLTFLFQHDARILTNGGCPDAWFRRWCDDERYIAKASVLCRGIPEQLVQLDPA